MNLSRRGFLGFTAALVPIHQSATREAPERESPDTAGTGGQGARREAGGTLYLGTYGDGIGIATYDAGGKLTKTGTIGGIPNPSFVIRDGSFLYAVNEQDAGAVTAIDILRYA